MKGGIRGLVIGSFVGGAAHVLIEKYFIKTGILYVHLNANINRITNRGLMF
jgi:archaellum component FlaF (FlaF/FlaG flagellin family)